MATPSRACNVTGLAVTCAKAPVDIATAATTPMMHFKDNSVLL
jgi:hypothetical protein